MMKRLFFLALTVAAALAAQPYTRGIGVYPGDPREDFSPAMTVDAAAYRNLALRRAAYHSSSYDYNLTANLVTDGIKETGLPRWLVVSTNDGGVMAKAARESTLDGFDRTGATLRGPQGWLQIEIAGAAPPRIDRINILGRFQGPPRPRGQSPAPPPPPLPAVEWTWTLQGSENGQNWTELARASGKSIDGAASLPIAAPAASRFYRLELRAPETSVFRIADLSLFQGNEAVQLAGPHHFHSSWKSEGAGEEWVYVDLGVPCTFDRVTLRWLRRAAEGALQVSADAVNWTTLESLPRAQGALVEIRLATPGKGRYVRVLMTKPAFPDGYILSEVEVWGRGGPVPRPKPSPTPSADGRLSLAGGSWRLQRDSLVQASGEQVSRPGFADAEWAAATVPGTTLVSYINLGAVPDPNFGENEVMISDSFFYADFWYRREFTAPPAAPGRRFWLNFDGVNWKAEVFLNGARLGRVDGAFMRGRFDATDKMNRGGRNALAVRVIKNATPGAIKEKGRGNSPTGGPVGADNPTFHASAGWDWMSTIRGRNTGIWSNVYLTQTGPVAIEDPRVETRLPLPDTSRADVIVEAALHNTEARPVLGTLRVRFGDAVVEIPQSLAASETRVVKLDPAAHPQLRLSKPRLWWPNGYGQPDLYPVELTFTTASKAVSDLVKFQTGVRQFTYTDDGGVLKIWINGRRFIGRGGNWGFSESTLRYRAREYDAALRYHRDLNFTMVRNWVGMTADEDFYAACDRYGIVVWQDFWLANPVDGANPTDNDLFLSNAADYIRKIRNHSSVGLYCGRNEGNPPKPLDDGLRQLTGELHPGLRYISNSSSGVVSGGGPYRVQPPAYYFTRAWPKLHSELGAPHVPSLDSLRLIMPENEMWPQSRFWPLHDFFDLRGEFPATIQKFGGAGNLQDWMELAQFVNYETYRAMFESQGKSRMGMLIWMSHSAWPSILWQTYDYFFNPDAGFFGSKKGAERLHIQWNRAADAVEVVNYNAGDRRGLTAKAEIFDLDGSLKWQRSASLDAPEDSTSAPIKPEYPTGLAPVHFIRLTLLEAGKVVSSNFYLRPAREDDYSAIRGLPKVTLEAATRTERRGPEWLLTTRLRNISRSPALMVRAKAVRDKSGDRILPALYDDNYVALMPGESFEIRTAVNESDTRGERPRIAVEGFNLERIVER
jgi:hypothetical protein